VSWEPNDPLPVAPELADDAVHVWCASLDGPPLPPARLREVLLAGERATAERHHFERDKSRSAASRGLLRWLLSSYLGSAPEQVRLRLGPHGKPELAGDQLGMRIFFNVAHCEDVALYGLSAEHELGIDVERLRAMPDALDMAARFFASAEAAALSALPARLRDEGFFVCWTRKEAFVKAQGSGLSVPLDEFEVGLDPFDGAGRVRIPADAVEAARWSVYDLHPRAGFIGALAVPDRDVRLKCWSWA